MASPILDVRDLSVEFATRAGTARAVDGVSLRLAAGETLCIVGESGCGKSITALSIMGLVPFPGRVTGGEIRLDGTDLRQMSAADLGKVRGNRVSMIFQDPSSSLNPVHTVGRQIAEAYVLHKAMNQRDAEAAAMKMLAAVGIPDPARRMKAYPHEMSGGMAQRVMIAMALACRPSLLIADEPTTALDVSIQDQILKLMRKLQAEVGMSILFITHDLGVVAELCSRVIVMYGGLVMEEAPIDALFENPMHPYTRGLLASIPSIDQDKARRLTPIAGSPPDMIHPPMGCPFAPRCPHARGICQTQLPPYTSVGEGRRSMCWLLTPEAPLTDNPFKSSGEVRV